jgi:hypothetical protein
MQTAYGVDIGRRKRRQNRQQGEHDDDSHAAVIPGSGCAVFGATETMISGG